jgi:hypothetical protein
VEKESFSLPPGGGGGKAKLSFLLNPLGEALLNWGGGEAKLLFLP